MKRFFMSLTAVVLGLAMTSAASASGKGGSGGSKGPRGSHHTSQYHKDHQQYRGKSDKSPFDKGNSQCGKGKHCNLWTVCPLADLSPRPCCYKGKHCNHWTYRCWSSCFGCYLFWDPFYRCYPLNIPWVAGFPMWYTLLIFLG